MEGHNMYTVLETNRTPLSVCREENTILILPRSVVGSLACRTAHYLSYNWVLTCFKVAPTLLLASTRTSGAPSRTSRILHLAPSYPDFERNSLAPTARLSLSPATLRSRACCVFRRISPWLENFNARDSPYWRFSGSELLVIESASLRTHTPQAPCKLHSKDSNCPIAGVIFRQYARRRLAL
jgi:hypothetical protein